MFVLLTLVDEFLLLSVVVDALLLFEFTPLLFVVSMQNGPIASIGWVKGVTSGKSITYNYTLLGDATISWEENGITFSDANGNFNASNYTYSYTAIGI